MFQRLILQMADAAHFFSMQMHRCMYIYLPRWKGKQILVHKQFIFQSVECKTKFVLQSVFHENRLPGIVLFMLQLFTPTFYVHIT